MRTKTAPAIGLLLMLGVTAGCGGGGGDDPKVASAGSPTATASSNQGQSKDKGNEKDSLLRFAKCMRENGVPNFPDPEFQNGGGVSLNLPEGTDQKAVEAAQRQCKSFMPNGGENQKVDPKVTEELRKYSKCMRDNGVPRFPDPGSEGGLQINNDQLGMAVDDPKYKAAEQTCSQHMPKPPGGGQGTQTNNAGGGA
ncbi:hypothetical protein [Embleya scabrispora]|uniref:hypothetical protein n=1 Tax=Embleya scabrispora TaxID=159449 RepID=UPI000377EDB6|nr:hypothetical protein [Embleya scabrispora]MYS85161.1 hypothetical protein [Streptomyces sp. SID5474]